MTVHSDHCGYRLFDLQGLALEQPREESGRLIETLDEMFGNRRIALGAMQDRLHVEWAAARGSIIRDQSSARLPINFERLLYPGAIEPRSGATEHFCPKRDGGAYRESESTRTD